MVEARLQGHPLMPLLRGRGAAALWVESREQSTWADTRPCK